MQICYLLNDALCPISILPCEKGGHDCEHCQVYVQEQVCLRLENKLRGCC